MAELVEKADPAKDAEAAAAAADDDDDNGPAPEEESTATFAPVVQLTAVETKSHEEDEECVFKQRSKLFIFGETMLDKGTGNKTWRERGVGEMKFLKHKENGRIRVLMRQEKTMKVIANHFLDPRITLTPNAGNDKSWVWVAFDFAEGELVETTFAIRFATPEIAQEYKKEFNKAQKEMEVLMAGGDATTGAEAADEAADAVAALSVAAKADEGGEKADAADDK